MFATVLGEILFNEGQFPLAAQLYEIARRSAEEARDQILMTMDNVKAIAAKYGIDLDRVRIAINKSLTGMGPGKELFGMTQPNGKIILSRDAFMSEDELARTLAHERFHLDELGSGLPFPLSDAAREAYEARAKGFEKLWWEAHKHLLGG